MPVNLIPSTKLDPIVAPQMLAAWKHSVTRPRVVRHAIASFARVQERVALKEPHFATWTGVYAMRWVGSVTTWQRRFMPLRVFTMHAVRFREPLSPNLFLATMTTTRDGHSG